MNDLQKIRTLSIIIVLMLISSHIFSQNKIVSKKDTISLNISKGSTESKFQYHFLSDPTKTDSISYKNKSDLFAQLKEIDFVSGQIYFSGAGFPNIIQTSLRGKGNSFEALIDKCIPGSIITFRNCKFKTSDGALKTLNKSVRLL